MDLTIPQELRLLKESAREYVKRELLPLEAQVEEEDDIPPETMRRLRKRAVELGFYGFNLPAELGGGGVGPLGQVLVGEELGRTTMALGEAFGRLSQSLSFCKGDQIDWLLKPALQADVTICNALTESDAAPIWGASPPGPAGRTASGGLMGPSSSSPTPKPATTCSSSRCPTRKRH